MNTCTPTRRPVSYIALAIAASLLLGGCTTSQVQYGWSHNQSGDYLFAFDSANCEQSTGNTSDLAFFSCMENLGYFRIDPVTGAPIASVQTDDAATDETLATTPVATAGSSSGR